MKVKTLYQVFFVLFVTFSLLVVPASAAFPFGSTTDWLNEYFVPWTDSLISTLIGIFVPILMFLLYPIIVIVNLLYEIASLVYSNAASIINIFLEIPNLISVLLSAWLPAQWPSVWTLLFLMSVGLVAFARVMRFLQYVKSWIPIIWG